MMHHDFMNASSSSSVCMFAQISDAASTSHLIKSKPQAERRFEGVLISHSTIAGGAEEQTGSGLAEAGTSKETMCVGSEIDDGHRSVRHQ